MDRRFRGSKGQELQQSFNFSDKLELFSRVFHSTKNRINFFHGSWTQKAQGWSSALDETKRIVISKHNANHIMQIGDRFIHNIIAVYVIVQIFQQRICRGPKLFLPVIRQLNWVKEGNAWAWMKDVLAHSFQIRISVYIARLRA